MCCLSQFVLPANCCTCTFSLSGAKSLTACALSPSPLTPVLLTILPSSFPSVCRICAFSTPNEKPLRIDTSMNASSEFR